MKQRKVKVYRTEKYEDTPQGPVIIDGPNIYAVDLENAKYALAQVDGSAWITTEEDQ